MQLLKRLVPWLPGIVLLVWSGCGSESPEAHRVDSHRARSTLESVLASWQQGETPESWKQKSPEVVVQDFDWQGGAKLQAFAILSEQPIDANLHCQVKLTMENDKQKTIERTVTYLVGTSPVLTVFREPGP